MDILVQKMMNPDNVRSVLTGAGIGAALSMASLVLTGGRETLDDQSVPHDYLKMDQTFLDSLIVMKPYAQWNEECFRNLIQLCDTLAYYFVMSSDRETMQPKFQILSLKAKRQIQQQVATLIDAVSKGIPEEAQTATENRDAFLNIVDSYVDNIQTECMEKARFIGDHGVRGRA